MRAGCPDAGLAEGDGLKRLVDELALLEVVLDVGVDPHRLGGAHRGLRDRRTGRCGRRRTSSRGTSGPRTPAWSAPKASASTPIASGVTWTSVTAPAMWAPTAGLAVGAARSRCATCAARAACHREQCHDRPARRVPQRRRPSAVQGPRASSVSEVFRRSHRPCFSMTRVRCSTNMPNALVAGQHPRHTRDARGYSFGISSSGAGPPRQCPSPAQGGGHRCPPPSRALTLGSES